jgi:hypothetical protein
MRSGGIGAVVVERTCATKGRRTTERRWRGWCPGIRRPQDLLDAVALSDDAGFDDAGNRSEHGYTGCIAGDALEACDDLGVEPHVQRFAIRLATLGHGRATISNGN